MELKSVPIVSQNENRIEEIIEVDGHSIKLYHSKEHHHRQLGTFFIETEAECNDCDFHIIKQMPHNLFNGDIPESLVKMAKMSITFEHREWSQ